MPAAQQAKLVAELQKIINSRQIRDNLNQQGWRAEDSRPSAFSERIKLDRAAYKDVISRHQIQFN